MSDKKNNKIKPQILVIAGVAVVLVVAAIVAGVISHNNKNKENTIGMTLTQKNLRPQDMVVDTDNEPKEITTVEILMDDTAIPVGTTFMAAAIVEPADTDKALVWSSSNQDVMTVEQDGLVTIKGIGTAALTATVGDVSDAVAIEGISSVTAGSKNGYTVYTGNGSLTKNSQSSSGSGSSSSASGKYSTASKSSSDTNNYQQSGSKNNNTYSGDPYNNSESSSGNSSFSGYEENNRENDSYNTGDYSNSGNTGNASGNNESNSGNTSGSGSSDGKTSSDIGDVLGGQGFTQEYSNVYVYTENGTYYGEIITQPNVSIIYIKQRNGGFDTRIKGVLEEMLPDSYDQVWNNYVSATSDRTFTVEGRKVRIVTASRGGHSQIVIYN